MNNYIGMKLDGRYELLELIGSGGMAEIYKADDTAEDKTVAVKILKNEFAESGEFLRRFRNESKAIALLSHPNIVKIFDVGFTDSVQFIVMEYIDGITLTEYIEKQGVLKWREALDYVTQILKALQHAHDRGIVHRDVKSQNVMLLKDGSIKVMDFGIARFNREIDKTMSEKAIGSVHYISPEQARGDITDEKSDLYSVGVMLYETLTGIKPFDGDDALAIALMHTNKKPKRPCEINSSIPPGLEEITLRAMQKDTAQRYQTAGEMMSDLREFEKNPSVIFEYKYSQPDGSTKYFDKVGKPVPNSAGGDTGTVPDTRDGRGKADYGVAVDGEGEDDYYEDDEIKERRSPLLPILFAVASAFVILAAVLISSIVGDLFGESKSQKMPNLIGESVDSIKSKHEWLYNIIEWDQEYSDTIPKDHVIEQSIPEGSKINTKRTRVTVKLSTGRKVIYMPEFTNLSTEEYVTAELDRLGLKVQRAQAYDEKVPKGYFIRSDRKAGDELAENDVVRIVISMGDEKDLTKSRVPALLNLTEAAAVEKATDSEVTLKIVRVESDELMKGKVLKQSVDPDEYVDKWSEVEVEVGDGPAENPEDIERDAFIAFTMPDTLTGNFEFQRYIDGELDKVVTLNVGYTKDFRWDFKNSGHHEYMIVIRNPANGSEGLYCKYDIDFTVENPTKTGTPDLDVFTKITTAPATAASTTTSSPSTSSPPATTN